MRDFAKVLAMMGETQVLSGRFELVEKNKSFLDNCYPTGYYQYNPNRIGERMEITDRLQSLMQSLSAPIIPRWWNFSKPFASGVAPPRERLGSIETA